MQKIRDNEAKSSINFQKANMKVAAFHNAREAFVPKSSHAELAEKNECSCSALAAIKKIQKWDSQADENYAKTHGGRRSPVKETSKVWEAVVNLRENHTMADVKKLTKKLEQKTGYKAAQIAIHRDEGHTNDDGDFIQNIHAHILFYARDPKTGLSLSTKHYGQTEFFEEIQDLVADELGMERGRSARETGAKHENMHSYKARKQAERAERAQNKEWEQKLAEKQAEWQAKMAEKQKEWERKQAEREARQAEWERKLPEIMEARRRNEQFLNGRVDWETLKTANRAFLAWHDISTDILGYPNPNGNLLIEQAKGSLASIFRLFGTVSQLAIFMLTRTEARELKLKNAMDVYKVSENLQRAVNLVANDISGDHRKIAEKIQSVFSNLPHDKRQELIELAILHAPNDEIRNDIRALIEGRFSHIARTEQAQRRIENRDLRAELKEYSEELRKIRDELKAMDEENRILVAAERAILKEKGAGRAEYAEQEAANRERLNDLKQLKDEQKALKKAIDEQKQPEQKDAQTIRELNEKIAELNEQIHKITAENAKKQRELEQELEAEKAARKTAEIITPQMLDSALKQIDELEAEKAARKTAETLDAFGIIDDLEQKLKPREEQKPEPIREEPKIEKPEPKIEPLKRSDSSEQSEAKPKPEPKPKQPAKDDFTNIYGYARPAPEPRHRFDDYERKTYDDRPKYEPEKIEQREQKDPWQEIEEDLQVWKTKEVVGEKALMAARISNKLDDCEKNGEMNDEKREYVRRVRYALNMLDPFKIAEQEAEARKNAETIRKVAAIHRELESKHKQAEIQNETDIKYEDVKAKNVRQEDDTRQQNLKKKRRDEYEMGMN